MKPDAYYGNDVGVLLKPQTYPGTAESSLVDVTGYHGVALVSITCAETNSTASTKTATIGIHNVASDSETPAAGNLLNSIVIAGSNSTSVVVNKIIAVDLDQLDNSTPKKYLQANITDANTYAGVMSIVVILPGSQVLPAHTSSTGSGT